MRKISSGIDLILLLLYFEDSRGKREIEGITRLTKMIFWLVKKYFANLDKEFEFEAWERGPWSPKICDYLELLESKDLISIEERPLKPWEEEDYDAIRFEEEQEVFSEEARNKMKIIRLTSKGEEVVKKITILIDRSEIEKIKEVKSYLNRLELREILWKTYTQYGKFTIKSKIKDNVLKLEDDIKRKYPFVREIDKELLNYVGILPRITIEDEKLLLRKIVEERCK